MRAAWLTSAVVALMGALVTVGCSPTQEVSPTVPVEATSGESVPAVEPTDGETSLGMLGEGDFPAEIGGFTFTWQGTPVYDVEGETSDDDQRIVVDQQVRSHPAEEYFEGVQAGHQELRPGVWCFVVADRGRDNCTVNSASGRLFLTMDMFDTMTTDQLAAWTESFIAEVP